jgi:hypothetical protein
MMTSAPTLERPPTRTSHCRRSPSTSASAADRPKTVLFCPCGREASTDEWHVEHVDGHRRLVCPDCGETLTVR